jgi:NAD(P)-dependent dehydrogenase (short-subunit alcohol dehydrogenase family)
MDCMDTRVAIVTGGARGIGAAITTTLARAGYHVAAGYSTNQTAAELFTGKLIADGLSLSVHKGNVGEPGDCLRVTEEVLSRHGRVDVLVNNAGITVDKTVRRMTVKAPPGTPAVAGAVTPRSVRHNFKICRTSRGSRPSPGACSNGDAARSGSRISGGTRSSNCCPHPDKARSTGTPFALAVWRSQHRAGR